tara:strand:- start:6606 stop:8651 length:2046 start_codon:yes stop_codon:yes gene_type:complete
VADRLVAINTAQPQGEQLPESVRTELAEVAGDLTGTVTTAVNATVPGAVSTAVGEQVGPAVTADIEARDAQVVEGTAPGTSRFKIGDAYGSDFPKATTWTEIASKPIRSVSEFGAVGDGVTDDTAAIQAALAWMGSNGGGILYLGWNHLVSATLVVPECTILRGHGGHSNSRGSRITSSATSGAVVHLSSRSTYLQGVRILSTTGRRAAVTTTGHGVYIGGDDVSSGYPFFSRILLADVDIRDQPTDGVHAIGTLEKSRFDLVTVSDCVRHGYVFDGGAIAGFSNIQKAPFMLELLRVRAFECGGQALICLSAGGEAPQGLYFNKFDALGCAWDSTKRNTVGVVAGAELFQIQLGGRGHELHRLDVEDQQYANSTTATGGRAKTARVVPSKGVFCKASGVTAYWPYFSSLVQSWLQDATTEGLEIVQPFIVSGTYGVNQSPAIQVPATCSGVDIRYSSSMTSGATTVVQNQSKNARIVANGLPRVGLGTTAISGWGDGIDPVGSTISAAVLTVAHRRTQVNGEGATTDNFQTMRLAPGVNGYAGMDIWLFRGAEDITVQHGTGNIRNLSGKDIVMTSTANTVLHYVYNGTNWVQASGLSLPVAAGAYTQTYATADKTLSAYTPDNESVAYTGNPADLASAAKLVDQNALRVAYENLRVFTEDLAQQHNSLIADLKALGLIQ